MKMLKFNSGIRDIGRYWRFMDKSYSDIIKSSNAQKRVQSNYNKIISLLKLLNNELNKLNQLEMSEDLDIRGILAQVADQINNLSNKETNNLNLTSLFDSQSNTQILKAQQSNKVQNIYADFKQQLKNAFLFNIDMQKQFHLEMPEFFDFISIRRIDGKTNLFMLDSKQLASFINNKDLVDFIPTMNKKGQIIDFQLSLKRDYQNHENFDDMLLNYLKDSNNAYFLNNTIADQAFNNNATYNQFITKDKFYNSKLTKLTKNTGQRTELMLQQLLNGKTVEQAYADGEGTMWSSTTRYTKTRNIARTVQVLNKDSEFGGAIGDSLGAIGINRNTKDFTFLNDAYSKKLNMSNYEKIYGNFQIKALDLSNPTGTFSFGSASSIIANNNLYTNEKNFQKAKQMYMSWVMADEINRKPKENQKMQQYEIDVTQAYNLAHEEAKNFIFSLAPSGLSDSELADLDSFIPDLEEKIYNSLVNDFEQDIDIESY